MSGATRVGVGEGTPSVGVGERSGNGVGGNVGTTIAPGVGLELKVCAGRERSQAVAARRVANSNPMSQRGAFGLISIPPCVGLPLIQPVRRVRSGRPRFDIITFASLRQAV